MPEPPKIRQERTERTKTFTDISLQKNRIFRALNDAYQRNGLDYDTYSRRLDLVGNIARQYRENIFSNVRGDQLLGWVNRPMRRSVYARR